MEQKLLDTCIDFCDLTSIVIVNLEPTRVRQGQAEYDIDVPPGTTTATLLDVWYGDAPITPVGPEWFTLPSALNSTVGGQASTTGTPQFAGIVVSDVIRLYPIPDATEPSMLTVRVATRPLRTAAEVDDSLFENWAEAIVWGAAERLHGVPNQPYTNPSREVTAHGVYRSWVNRARIEATKGRVRSSAAVRRRPLA